jgi:hypothetical protein
MMVLFFHVAELGNLDDGDDDDDDKFVCSGLGVLGGLV